MGADDLKWLLGLLLAIIAINIPLINVLLNDKVRNPLRLAILVDSVSALVVGGFAYVITSSYVASLAILIETAAMFGIIGYVLKERDRKGIRLGEDFIEFERVIDVQTSYILTGLTKGRPQDATRRGVCRALEFILDILGEYLGLTDSRQSGHDHHHSMSIFLAKADGKFEVLACSGMTPEQTERIEGEFRYKPDIISVAGYCANKGLFVCISDLAASKPDDDPSHYWIQSETNEKKQGFLMCFPIFRGVGPKSANPMAVMSLSSQKKQAYDCDSTRQVVERIASKVENLIYLYELPVGQVP